MAKRTSKVERAYVAGFLDGEGTISMSMYNIKAGWTPYLRVAISNYDPNPLRRIEGIWGGSLNIDKNDVWSLCLNGDDAMIMLSELQPYVLIKREAVDAAIEMYKHKDDRLLWLTYAAKAMEATRAGYKAIRSRKYLDRVYEEIELEKARRR